MEGVKVEVPTLEGSLRIQIPAGAQLGQKLRLKQRGLPRRLVVREICIWS